MWTQTLSLNKTYDKEFGYLLREVAQLSNISYAVEKSRDRLFVTVAFEDVNSEAVTKEIKKIIHNIILIFFKYNHLTENTNKEITLPLFALYAALIFFEAEEDHIVINNSLKNVRDFAIDALFLFKIHSVLIKWNELIKLADNLLAMNPSDDDILNVVAFLSDLQENKKEITVSYNKGYTVARHEMLNAFDDERHNLLLTVISLKPSKIVIESITDAEILKILSKIAKISIATPEQ